MVRVTVGKVKPLQTDLRPFYIAIFHRAYPGKVPERSNFDTVLRSFSIAKSAGVLRLEYCLGNLIPQSLIP